MKSKTNYIDFEKQIFNFINIENLFFEKIEILEYYNNISKNIINKVLKNLIRKQKIISLETNIYYVFKLDE